MAEHSRNEFPEVKGIDTSCCLPRPEMLYIRRNEFLGVKGIDTLSRLNKFLQWIKRRNEFPGVKGIDTRRRAQIMLWECCVEMSFPV